MEAGSIVGGSGVESRGVRVFPSPTAFPAFTSFGYEQRLSRLDARRSLEGRKEVPAKADEKAGSRNGESARIETGGGGGFETVRTRRRAFHYRAEVSDRIRAGSRFAWALKLLARILFAAPNG